MPSRRRGPFRQPAARVAARRLALLPLALLAGAAGPATAEDAGLLAAWQARGITLEAGLTADHSALLAGGAEPDTSATRYLAEAGVRLASRPLLGYPGGELVAGWVYQDGEDGSLAAGDFQAYANIDAADFSALYRLWYQQRLLDGRLRLKLGKLDANSEFAYVDNGAEFVHSSPGFSPTIQAFPSYPDPATSVNLFVEPGGALYAGVGVYDGATQAGLRTGTHGPGSFFGRPSDLFYIAEAGTGFAVAGAPGRLGVGAWRHTGDFERFDGGRADHADGIYLVLDQALRPAASAAPARGPGLFLQYGRADPQVSEVTDHAGAGLQWRGPLAARPEDSAGAMASYVAFSDAPQAGFTDDYELALELFYAARINRWLVLQPDLQYLVHPGGRGLPDARVVTLRLRLAL